MLRRHARFIYTHDDGFRRYPLQQQGQPELVKSNIGPIVPLGFTQDGSFYYGQWPPAENIYTTEIDVESGSILTPPTIIIKRFEGKNSTPDYSSDGRSGNFILTYLQIRDRQQKYSQRVLLYYFQLQKKMRS